MSSRVTPEVYVRFEFEFLGCHLLARPLERLLGLLSCKWSTLGAREAVLFPQCSSVHTFGMRKPIDICFLDSTAGIVLSAQRRIGAGRILYVSGADMVIERFANSTCWPRAGSDFRLDGR